MDAQHMCQQHPGSFWAPSVEDIEALELHHLVKICDGMERFWTILVDIDKAYDHPFEYQYAGYIDNDLVGGQTYNCGSLIAFRGKNIYDIGDKVSPSHVQQYADQIDHPQTND